MLVQWKSFLINPELVQFAVLDDSATFAVIYFTTGLKIEVPVNGNLSFSNLQNVLNTK